MGHSPCLLHITVRSRYVRLSVTVHIYIEVLIRGSFRYKYILNTVINVFAKGFLGQNDKIDITISSRVPTLAILLTFVRRGYTRGNFNNM